MTIDNLNLLTNVIDSSLNELRQDFKRTDNGAGWHQYFHSSKIGVVATAQALQLLSAFGTDLEPYGEAIQFIVDSQSQIGRDTDMGGWAYVSNITEVANTEGTCWALRALTEVPGDNSKSIKAGLDWLDTNFINGDLSGWGTVKSSGVRTYPTCMALQTLKKLKQTGTSHFSLALNSLKSMQRDDGGWGETQAGSSTVVHTAHCILSLISCGVSTASSQVVRGIDFIVSVLNRQLLEGDKQLGYVEIFDVRFPVGGAEKTQRMTFYHSPICYAIRALIACNGPSEVIYTVILRLLKDNQTGHWHHPYLPNKTTTWAVYDALSLLHMFQKSSYVSAFQGFNDRPEDNLREAFDLLVVSVVPIEFITINRLIRSSMTPQEEYFLRGGYPFMRYDLDHAGRRKVKCLVTMVGSAGEVDCTLACMVAFRHFQIRTAVLCGIAAGHKKQIKKYDSIFSESVVSYEFQRLEKDKVVFRPRFFSISPRLKRLLSLTHLYAQQYNDLVKRYITELQLDVDQAKGFSLEQVKMSIGTIASGSKLIADGRTVEMLRDSLPVDKGIAAAEMEGSGFAAVCEENKIDWLVIRGISDFGGTDKSSKNKEMQPLAVASAFAALNIFFNYVFEPDN